MENHLVITGRLIKRSEMRLSPAGLPIGRFTLEHSSRQMEAGFAREARCRIMVIACGRELQATVEKLDPGTRLQVCGFISRANHRQGENRLVVHAERIEILDNV